MNNGRKIEPHQENPLDNLILIQTDKVSIYLHNRVPNITPNIITTIGLIFGLLSIYSLYKEYYILSFVLFWINYFFDCLDGHYERKYNMTTQFGDYYDHFRDFLIIICICTLIFIKLKTNKQKILFTIIIGILIYLTTIHLGCQEDNSNSIKDNKLLQELIGLCKYEIEYTRYFGCGTLISVISFYILYCYKQ